MIMNKNNEQWVVINDFPRYSVSSIGRVKNNVSGIVLSQRKAANGYQRVNLRKGDRKYEPPTVIHVHRLVASAFVDGYKEGFQVNHIDGNKDNNGADNLEWVSGSENIIHARKTGLYSAESVDNLRRRGNDPDTRAKIKAAQHTEQYRKKMQASNAANGITKPVIQSDKNGLQIAVYDNCEEAARVLFGEQAVNKGILIARCARGKCKSAYGFNWKYKEGR